MIIILPAKGVKPWQPFGIDIEESIRGSWGSVRKGKRALGFTENLPKEEDICSYPRFRPQKKESLDDHFGCVFDLDGFVRNDRCLKLEEETMGKDLTDEIYVFCVSKNKTQPPKRINFLNIKTDKNNFEENLEIYLKVIRSLMIGRLDPKYNHTFKEILKLEAP